MSNIEIEEKIKPVPPKLIVSTASVRLDHLSSLLAVVKKEV